MRLKPFILLEKCEVLEETRSDTYAKFFLAPLEKGWGYTIGTALRRALLSSVQGSAITQVRIENVLHEFSTIPDVLEDVPQIILNLKKVRLLLNSETPKNCYLYTKEEGVYRARDLTVPPEITIATPDQEILTLTEPKSMKIELKVENGRGYVSAEKLRKKEEAPIGTIFLDAFFSPVKKVTFQVENVQILDRGDLERVILEITTDGTVSPEEALIQVAILLRNSFDAIIPKEKEPEFIPEEKFDKDRRRLQEILTRDVEELELSNRALNCLKRGRYRTSGEKVNIKTIGDLVQLREENVLDIENFGRKSLEELKNILESWGLSLGMDIGNIVKKEE